MKKFILFTLLVSSILFSNRAIAASKCEDVVWEKVNDTRVKWYLRHLVVDHSLFVISYLNQSRLTEQSAYQFTNSKLKRFIRDDNSRKRMTNMFMNQLLEMRKSEECKHYYQ